MRFLLHASRQKQQHAAAAAASKAPWRSATASNRSSDRRRASPKQIDKEGSRNDDNATAPLLHSWGQQCSSNCGCVVRFDAHVRDDQIVTLDYTAKSVVTRRDSQTGTLQPLRTNRTNQPMLNDTCRCTAVHTLCQSISERASEARWSHLVRNSLEFTGVRSSTAFRHAVLHAQGLSTERSTIHCFDVVEEAFTALIKQALPMPRRRDASFREHLLRNMVPNQPLNTTMVPSSRGAVLEENDDDDIATDAVIGRRLQYRPTRTSLSSTLRMFDENQHRHHVYDDEENDDDGWVKEFDGTTTSTSTMTAQNHNWISYVDEMYANENRSA